tara:strand:+ start:1015 stop:2163 length:1149 start_codon:yes stop_codon:yes gene_type:complete
MGDFKDGWNTFSVSVANHTLAWHLNKLTGKVKFDVEFENNVAYYMVTSNGTLTRNVNESVRWGDVTGKEILQVGIPYWIYLTGVSASNAITFNAYPVGWDIYYPDTNVDTNFNINSQWASYGDLYGSSNLPYLKLSRSATTNTGYFFELGQGDAFFSNKVHIGKPDSTYTAVTTTNQGNGELTCYVSPDHYLEIKKVPTADTTEGQSSSINLSLYDTSGNTNIKNTPKVNFFNKYNQGDTTGNQDLGAIEFYGYRSSRYLKGASIKVSQEERTDPAKKENMPTKIDFSISDDTSNDTKMVMSVSSNNDSTHAAVDVSGTFFADVLKIPVIQSTASVDKYEQLGSLLYSDGNNTDISDNSLTGATPPAGLYIYLVAGWKFIGP